MPLRKYLPTVLVVQAFMATLVVVPALGQEGSAFLVCDRYTDRAQRLQCLDDALADAVGEQTTGQDDAITSVDDFGRDSMLPPSVMVRSGNAGEDGNEEKGLRLSRLPLVGGLFNRNRDEEEDVAMPAVSGGNDRLADFGRQGQAERTRIVTNDEGQDELYDVITQLVTIKPGQWEITLASGQVWRQVNNKSFNLRAGEEVHIYPTNWGDDYRLETERLNGFIQITRVR